MKTCYVIVLLTLLILVLPLYISEYYRPVKKYGFKPLAEIRIDPRVRDMDMDDYHKIFN